jgi:DNA-binding MarR family transcriptional regulator
MPKNPQSSGVSNGDHPAHHAVGFLLKSLHHTLRQIFDETMRKKGVELSFAQFAALFNLHCDPGVTGAQIARRAMVSAQTMSSALHGLELDGYIERRPHPFSRRADSWSLTDSGLEELKRARAVGTAVFARMLGGFDAAEIAAFEDYLRRSITALGGEVLAPADAPRTRGARGWNEAPAVRARRQRRQNAGVNSTRNV